MTEPLSQRQSDVLLFILCGIKGQGFKPSIREIGDRFGIQSTNGVVCHLQAIERKGYIIRHKGARSIEITDAAWEWYGAIVSAACREGNTNDDSTIELPGVSDTDGAGDH